VSPAVFNAHRQDAGGSDCYGYFCRQDAGGTAGWKPALQMRAGGSQRYGYFCRLEASATKSQRYGYFW
jgi:hypothetical protein